MKNPAIISRKKLLIWGGIVLVAAGAALYWFVFREGGAPAVRTNTAVVEGLSGKPLTTQDVANADKTEAFFSYFLNAAQQQQTVLTTEVKEGTAPGNLDPGQTYYKIGFDYKTKQSVFATDVWTATTYNKQRCYQGKELTTPGFSIEWKLKNISASSPCQIGKHAMTYLSDGINTGGLTTGQAQNFVGYLRAQPGLVTVQKLVLEEHKGKQYLHFTAQLMPIATKDGLMGGQWLMSAFRKTGLNPGTHPYNFRPASEQGVQIEYYSDPAAKLPAYSEMHTLPAKDSSNAAGTYQQWRVLYQFGSATFDASINNNLPLTVDW